MAIDHFGGVFTWGGSGGAVLGLNYPQSDHINDKKLRAKARAKEPTLQYLHELQGPSKNKQGSTKSIIFPWAIPGRVMFP